MNSKGTGRVADIAVSSKRGITFLEKELWHTVLQELGVRLPWRTRRANVLVEVIGREDLIVGIENNHVECIQQLCRTVSFRHSRESGNPVRRSVVQSRVSGFPLSRE